MLVDLAKKYGNYVDMVKAEAAANHAACVEFKIPAFPTLVMLRDGVEVGRHFGNSNYAALEEFIVSHISKTFITDTYHPGPTLSTSLDNSLVNSTQIPHNEQLEVPNEVTIPNPPTPLSTQPRRKRQAASSPSQAPS